MRKVIVLIVMIVLCKYSIAQLNLTVQIPPSGVVQTSQLWNVMVVNSSNESLTIVLDLTLMSTDNIPLLKATSKMLTLSKGVKQIRESDVLPVNYDYLSSTIGKEGFLPIGEYRACYTIAYLRGDAKIVAAEDCLNIEVTPIQPPLLNSPGNGEVIQTKYPQFTWLPPAPQTLYGQLNYSLIIVEVMADQSPTQAIQTNVPVYNRAQLKDLFNAYPSSGRALDTGKLYAWRIVANNNNVFAGQSDVWTFKVMEKRAGKKLIDMPYVKLEKRLGRSLIASRGILKIEYTSLTNDQLLPYRIKDAETGEIVKASSIAIKYGQNFLDVNVSKDNVCKNGRTYVIEVTNSRSETWYMKFKYLEEQNEIIAEN